MWRETMNKEDLLHNIMAEFEDFLDHHNITIPSEDREGAEEEARIFGSEYYNLEDKIKELINK